MRRARAPRRRAERFPRRRRAAQPRALEDLGALGLRRPRALAHGQADDDRAAGRERPHFPTSRAWAWGDHRARRLHVAQAPRRLEEPSRGPDPGRGARAALRRERVVHLEGNAGLEIRPTSASSPSGRPTRASTSATSGSTARSRRRPAVEVRRGARREPARQRRARTPRTSAARHGRDDRAEHTICEAASRRTLASARRCESSGS